MINQFFILKSLFLKKLKQSFLVGKALFKDEITFYPNFVDNFERKFAEYTGSKYGLSFCNGTSAIEAALFAIGVKPHDEIIVPSCTFHASIDPILNAGATPVFADVEKNSVTICVEDIEKKITDNTKAIIAVNLFGIPSDLLKIKAIAHKKNIALIEDDSHAHGASLNNKKCGSIGDIGVFSLQGRKAVAAGEGGIAVTDSEEYFLRMSLWGHFDRHADRFDKIHADAFAHTGFGYKRRIAPLSILLAKIDLDYLDFFNRVMANTANLLDDEMSNLTSFRSANLPENSQRGGFFGGYPILIKDEKIKRGHLKSFLWKNNIETADYPFELHHQLNVYNQASIRVAMTYRENPRQAEIKNDINLPRTEDLKQNMFLLPRKYLLLMSAAKIRKFVGLLKQYETNPTSS